MKKYTFAMNCSIGFIGGGSYVRLQILLQPSEALFVISQNGTVIPLTTNNTASYDIKSDLKISSVLFNIVKKYTFAMRCIIGCIVRWGSVYDVAYFRFSRLKWPMFT